MLQSSKFIIGRMPKFFTLWRVVHTAELTTDNDFIGDWVHYEFIKNLTKDESKVRLLYPDAEIIDNFQPTDEFITRKERAFCDNDLQSTNRVGDDIREIEDADFLRFVYSRLSPIQKSHAAFNLIGKGYAVLGDTILSPDELAAVERYNEFKATVEAGEPFNIFFGTNLNQDGEYIWNGYVVTFKDYDQHFPDGLDFSSVPLGFNVKFIKGRYFRVTSYLRGIGGTIVVKKMEAIKTTGDNPYTGQL